MAARNGGTPRPTSIAPQMATGEPAPAAPSINAPKQKTMTSAAMSFRFEKYPMPERIDCDANSSPGKRLEIPVKRILRGAEPDDVASRDALTDPTSLDVFASMAR